MMVSYSVSTNMRKTYTVAHNCSSGSIAYKIVKCSVIFEKRPICEFRSCSVLPDTYHISNSV